MGERITESRQREERKGEEERKKRVSGRGMSGGKNRLEENAGEKW